MDLDKKQALYDLSESTGFPVFLEVLDSLVRHQESRLLSYDTRAQGQEGLLYVKCELDGAKKLRYAIDSYFKELRVAASKA